MNAHDSRNFFINLQHERTNTILHILHILDDVTVYR